ncbi:MAG TPA: hypothetical protein VGV37_06815 [Aliidongia sp.]|uniref:hypothetical protein n=1 Tax=Aliidongia sp. TaxID=1914230 RepID=UPI002DDD0766|nr:hypothetical protein [Aliidongia sp.]HEV2674238.1 hypothetical protein [Aliidongia sp.]
MSHAEILLWDIRRGLQAFGAGHSAAICKLCGGDGFRTLDVSLLPWRRRIPCQNCRRTGFQPLGDPRGLAAQLLDRVDTVQDVMEDAEAVSLVLHVYRVPGRDLERILQTAGYRARWPIQTTRPGSSPPLPTPPQFHTGKQTP